MSSESDYSFLSEQDYTESTFSSECEPTDLQFFVCNDIIEIRNRIKHETNIRDLDGWLIPILINVIRSRFDTLASYIISKCHDIQGMLDLRPILHEAASVECIEVMNYLIVDKHVNPDIQDCDGQTPLHVASSKGMLESINFLISHNADINFRNDEGNTPLHEAVYCEKIKAVHLLLLHNARINIKNNKYRTPLYLAFEHFDPFIIETLINHGAIVNVRDKHGNTPLHAMLFNHGNYYVCEKYILKYIETLIKHNIDINSKNNNRNTPLYEFVKALSRIDCLNDHKQFILDVIEFLINKGADLDIKNESGKTVLDLISQYEHLNFINSIICKNSAGKRPMSLGRSKYSDVSTNDSNAASSTED